MSTHAVVVFKQYPFEIDQKICIADGPRAGDWLVIGISERKVKLHCPVSGREFEWDRFCYQAETLEDAPWPLED